MILGEHVDLMPVEVLAGLVGATLGEAEIARRTGLNVIGVSDGANLETSPGRHSLLMEGGELIVVGTAEYRKTFEKSYGKS